MLTTTTTTRRSAGDQFDDFVIVDDDGGGERSEIDRAFVVVPSQCEFSLDELVSLQDSLRDGEK